MSCGIRRFCEGLIGWLELSARGREKFGNKTKGICPRLFFRECAHPGARGRQCARLGAIEAVSGGIRWVNSYTRCEPSMCRVEGEKNMGVMRP